MNCSQIYIGTDLPVGESRSEIFSVELITESDFEYLSLKSMLNKNYIYYLAPHSGCGCGWEVLHTESEYDELSKKSLVALNIFLNTNCAKQPVFMLTCNQAAVGKNPEFVSETNVSMFVSNLGSLRPKYGETQARLYLVKA